jgi:hypothetical protein
MTVKSQHKDLKKEVNLAEQLRSGNRSQKSWYDLRVLKKLKLRAKEKLKAMK